MTPLADVLRSAPPPGSQPRAGFAPAPPRDRLDRSREDPPSEEEPPFWRRAALMGLACLSAMGGVAQAAPDSAPSLPTVSTTQAAEAPRLRFREDGTFKILQWTDLHFQPEESAEYRQEYVRSLEALLDAEKPDLVVLTGDVLYWSGRPMEEYFGPTLAPLVERGIPWAFAMGNHDAESWFSGSDVMAHLEGLPLSLSRPGPETLGATGNYAVEVQGRDGETDAVLYLLDTHDRPIRAIDPERPLLPQFEGAHARPDFPTLERKYGADALEAWRTVAHLDPAGMATAWQEALQVRTPSGRPLTVTREDFQPFENHGYAWLTPEQVKWYDGVSEEYTRREGGAPIPSLLFMHIPIPEYEAAWRTKATGTRLEPESAQGRNTGLFSTLKENRDVMGVFAGHDHLNDYVGWLDGVALGYGRKTGISVYGPAPMQRGGRVIVLHEDQRKFDTWVRTVDGRVENPVTVPDHFTR